MLSAYNDPKFSSLDEKIFDALVLRDHQLRLANKTFDFLSLREQLAEHYSSGTGRPGIEPVLMLKLSLLQYLYSLSDRQVVARAQTDIAFRYFLGLGMNDVLPDPSSLTYFRGRLGVDGFRKVFDNIVGQSREMGLVKDRLRLKDATHVIADVAIPNALSLVAQTRDLLLSAAEPFDPARVVGERARIAMIRTETSAGDAAARLEERVTHLREIIAWVEELTPPEDAESNSCWQKLQRAQKIAQKVLHGQDEPEAGDRIVSLVDIDARCGWHHQYYYGYLVDLLIDADSELITAIDVLPANGAEAANAPNLVRSEEEAHQNDIEQFSIDGIGMNGPVLRELQDPEGLNLDVYVPTGPAPDPAKATFGPDAFTEDKEAGVAQCPAGQTSGLGQREENKHRTVYRFNAKTCANCPLKDQCLSNPNQTTGRTVRKNDYDPEYSRAREKTKTPEYEAVRKQHPRVERKIADMMRRHGGRRARYRGHPKVLRQQLLAGTATNLKRIVNLRPLFCAPNPA